MSPSPSRSSCAAGRPFPAASPRAGSRPAERRERRGRERGGESESESESESENRAKAHNTQKTEEEGGIRMRRHVPRRPAPGLSTSRLFLFRFASDKCLGVITLMRVISPLAQGCMNVTHCASDSSSFVSSTAKHNLDNRSQPPALYGGSASPLHHP